MCKAFLAFCYFALLPFTHSQNLASTALLDNWRWRWLHTFMLLVTFARELRCYQYYLRQLCILSCAFFFQTFNSVISESEVVGATTERILLHSALARSNSSLREIQVLLPLYLYEGCFPSVGMRSLESALPIQFRDVLYWKWWHLSLPTNDFSAVECAVRIIARSCILFWCTLFSLSSLRRWKIVLELIDQESNLLHIS